MLPIDSIKQKLESNTNKKLSSSLLKKMALMKIEERFANTFSSWKISDLIDKIINSELPEDKKGDLLRFANDEIEKAYSDSKKSLEELFGRHPKEDNEYKVETKEKKISKNYVELKNNEKKETPSEFTTNRDEGKIIFNY